MGQENGEEEEEEEGKERGKGVVVHNIQGPGGGQCPTFSCELVR